jgi:Spy/CpxP family protein refolding chaperone
MKTKLFVIPGLVVALLFCFMVSGVNAQDDSLSVSVYTIESFSNGANISSDQIGKIADAWFAVQRKTAVLNVDMEQAAHQLASMMCNPKPDAKKAMAMVNKIGEIRKELDLSRLSFVLKMAEVLTPDQMKKVRAMMAGKKPGAAISSNRCICGEMHEAAVGEEELTLSLALIEDLQEDLKITPEQMTKLNDLWMVSEKQMIAINGLLQNHALDLKKIMSSNEPDAKQAVKIVEQICKYKTDADFVKLKFVLGTMEILSVDQLKKIRAAMDAKHKNIIDSQQTQAQPQDGDSEQDKPDGK